MVEIIVGIMGPGVQATPNDIKTAYTLGQAIAQAGWIVLTGGRNVGVMDAASRGAKAGGGTTIGILPTADTTDMSSAVDIPIVTDLGQARNVVNVLTSRAVVACGCGPGTVSEIALAIKANKPLILMETGDEARQFWQNLCSTSPLMAATVDEAMTHLRNILS
mgnify:CR=1 FL=1